MTGRRLPSGGAWIDRSKPLRFRFDGVEYEGFEGDTLASALLANDVVGGFRSPILDRPRGIYSAGPEEPNAFVEISEPWFDPIVTATMVELVDGLVAQSRSGLGRLARTAAVPSPRVEHRHTHVEVLVIGSGHDGLFPAEEAAHRGDRVLLVEQLPTLAGAGTDWRPDGVTYLTRATAIGLYDDGYAIVHERSLPRDRLWHVRAKHVVLATGGVERPIAFAGNDRPGVMLASSADRYRSGFGVRTGERVAIFTARSPTYGVASSLRESGAEVVAIADVRPDARLVEPADAVTTLLPGWVVDGTDGVDAITGVRLRGPDGEMRTVNCDSLLVSGGWSPELTLWRSIGGGLRFNPENGCFVPDGSGPSWLSVVGSAAGDVWNGEAFWFVPAEDSSTHFVDFQRDQTVADVAAAVGGGLRSVEHVKRATYIGTAIDQGRTSNVLAAEIVNALLGAGPGAQGPTSARPPAVPVSFAALAGPYRGHLLDPIRSTPMHARHVELGAVFEDVGQWKRPRYYPLHRESLDDAVARECVAVRTAVGAMDASTLGKIEVVGPDAAAFLDRMYTNLVSNLAVGSIRYGLLCGLDGMVFDDGVAMRLAPDRYLVTTTTGGAAPVLDHFEEWLQTEWPDLRVFCTSVTEQWAVIAVNGPRAREVIAEAGTDVDLDPEAFPFMTLRDGTVGGVPARFARVSFSGELAYELHVDARRGAEVWDTILAAGAPFGLAPYGTEAMHVLRAEKGYVIVGQDADGTVTPFDLGLDRLVHMAKGDFIGRRSFARADTSRPDRLQLVGLLPEDPSALLPEGAPLVLEDVGTIPTPTAGHVTSSYRSPALGRTVALAMLRAGNAMHGRVVLAPLPEGSIAATVTMPAFYDPEGARRDG